MKKLAVLVILVTTLLIGCATTQSSTQTQTAEEYYVLKDYQIDFLADLYYNQRFNEPWITKWRYRQMPHYLRVMYEKSE